MLAMVWLAFPDGNPQKGLQHADVLTVVLQSTKRHLSKKLENLDWKVEEQKEITQLITNDV